MRKRMFSDSDVAQMLNDVDRLIDAGSSATAACRQIGISPQSYHRWRKERSMREAIARPRQPRRDLGAAEQSLTS